MARAGGANGHSPPLSIMKLKTPTEQVVWRKGSRVNSALFAVLLLPAVAMTALALDVRDGLVSYWPLDEVTGGTTADAAFTNAMTVVGSPSVVAGKFGNAFTLANNIYLTNLHAADAFPTAGLPIYQAGSYTICMWVKGTNQTAKYLYTEGNLASAATLFVLQTGNAAANNAKLDVVIRTDANTTLMNHVVSTAVVFDNTWHHIAWVDENGRARLYVDGQLDVANFNYTRSGAFTLSSSAIGTLVRNTISSTAVFNGQIDDVAIWERPLSPAEIEMVRTNGITTPITPVLPALYEVPANATRNLGDWNIFSVRAYAHRPDNNFTYQWYRNGAPIFDGTGRTYQTEHLTSANTGDFFSVQVSNGVGSTNSADATLTVQPDLAPDVRNGLISHWPLDVIEQADTNLLSPDLYSHTDMVLWNFSGTNDFVSGHQGNALSFDNITKYTHRTNGTAIYMSTNHSVSLWVQGDYSFQNDRRVYSEGSPTNNNALFTLGTDPAGTSPSASVLIRPDVGATGVNSRRSTRAVFDNTWHHLVWTDANGRGKLYVDGVLDETDYTYTRATTTLSQTSLGAVLRGVTVGNYYFGNVDDVATWNRVLSYTEIQDIMNNGIPAPVAAIPPSIAQQPADRTNNTWVGDTVSFSAAANGTFPLSFQWWKDGTAIATNLNPSAATDTLALTNVQLGANGLYWLVVSNTAGTTNSSVVQLLAKAFTPVTNGEALKIDVGLASSPNLQPGFDEFTLAVNGSSYNAVGVTVTSIGGVGLASRNRLTDSPVWVTNSPPRLTQASVYNDFIYASSAAVDVGMKVLIERLAPNTPFGVTIWSYDVNSTGTRVSDWTETSSGTPIPVATEYTFSGSNRVTNDFQYTFGGLFTSSPAGKLQFEGRRNAASVGGAGSADIGVFFNAIRVVARPVGTRVRQFGIVNGNLEVQIEGDYPGQPLALQESSTLAPGSWSAAVGATATLTNGPAVIFEIPTGASPRFYRAVSQPAW